MPFDGKDAQGCFVGFVEVGRLAVVAGITLHMGRFCNLGASQRWSHLDTKDTIMLSSIEYTCGNDHGLFNGIPLGSLRISFGAMANKVDIDMFCDVLVRYYCNRSL
ncbi:hypothetical protein IW140_002917 [Coemansia sp. RSA 1813]|nr:hypothetical protein EV178_002837 [Coemansia sp. RSA 1646]KAJ1771978.1 hypothetical protein LPJ74_001870 [Coemansia sp. RSA 1843]KAJ2569663.1 hypothetical protein IW140_002917 [Coemansia sp. RSA 1813]